MLFCTAVFGIADTFTFDAFRATIFPIVVCTALIVLLCISFYRNWFMARARVLVDGIELGNSCLGGLLYADAREFLKDIMAEDLILDAMTDAKHRLTVLAKKFTMLAIKHS